MQILVYHKACYYADLFNKKSKDEKISQNEEDQIAESMLQNQSLNHIYKTYTRNIQKWLNGAHV